METTRNRWSGVTAPFNSHLRRAQIIVDHNVSFGTVFDSDALAESIERALKETAEQSRLATIGEYRYILEAARLYINAAQGIK